MAQQYPTVDTVIASLEVLIKNYREPISIRSVCNELSIFDWWPENLNLNHMKQMLSFLKCAKQIGFRGYCCFKVGASGCANGMWAYRELSINGYSPDTSNYMYRSFTPDYTVWILNDVDLHIETDSLSNFKQALRNR